MNWIIMCVVSVIIFTLSLVGLWRLDKYCEFFLAIICISVLVAISSVMIYFCGTLDGNKTIVQFEQQKQYIESHTAQNEIEDAALTSKKIELNGWLYSAQWSRRKFGNWSLVPEHVLELEAIK